MLDSNPESIVCFPLIPMEPFNRTLGAIPVEFGGGNRYRVIWAPSRKILRFTSGVSEIVSAYGRNGIEPLSEQMGPQNKAGEVWILEQWRNPYRDCTEAEWNTIPIHGIMTRLQIMGPFPRQGYYWKCENTYLYGQPTVSQVERQILMVEDGQLRHSPWNNFVAIREKVERGQKSVDAERKDRIDSRLLQFGGEAMGGYGGGRGTKTIEGRYTAKDLQKAGISTKPGGVSMMPRRKKITYDLSPFIR